MNRAFWRGKRVFLTGHTGFKGGWLALWLAEMGAEVHGYALTPPTEPNFFTVASLPARLVRNTIADIRDAAVLTQAMQTAQPDIVLHLAAQPLVRYSYVAPVETYAVNVMGTVNLLEAVRQTPSVKAVVNVTTDKCYENREWVCIATLLGVTGINVIDRVFGIILAGLSCQFILDGFQTALGDPRP